jgi:hypothetical protein
MTGRLMHTVGTYSDGRQTAVLSCRPLLISFAVSVYMLFWYPRVEDTVDGEYYL